MPTPYTKVCCRCKQDLPAIAFYKRGDSLRGECRECRSKYSKQKQFSRSFQLRALYGITLAEHNELLVRQGGKCAICGCPSEFSAKGTLAVDHNHETLKVRGLLCGECNLGLGKFKDSKILLTKALEYLSHE